MMKLWTSGSGVAVPTISAFSSHLELVFGAWAVRRFSGGGVKALSFDAQPFAMGRPEPRMDASVPESMAV